MEKPNHYIVQRTLARPVTLSGHGLHTGIPSSVTICPAPSDHGIVFSRSDIGVTIKADHQHVDLSGSTLSTVLTNKNGSVRTVEHVLSALIGMEINNAIIEVLGEEIPIMDGSSSPFVNAILNVGLKEQTLKTPVFFVTRPVEYKSGDKTFMAVPGSSFKIDYFVDFGNSFRQQYSMVVSPHSYRMEVARAKTFCSAADLEKIRSAGLAKGGTRKNALIVGPDRILNPESQSYPDELVRHKILDFIGDMGLAEGRILGSFTVSKGGHRFHIECLKEMIKDRVLELREEPKKYGVLDLAFQDL